jgi:hypothetical protein
MFKINLKYLSFSANFGYRLLQFINSFRLKTDLVRLNVTSLITIVTYFQKHVLAY